jgi:colicin import membrane protein
MMPSKGKATLSKSDRPESSVLFSLRELRQIEDERVKAEAEARKAQAEAERRAKAEFEARARDEEGRRVREEEERRQQAESEREERRREDRLRVEEAERRARVEGELQLRKEQLLEEQRQRHMEGRRFGRSAWMGAAAVAALFVAVGGQLAARASRQHQAEKSALEREIARRGEQARAAQMDFDARVRALEERARRDVGEAKTGKNQARILGDLQGHKQAIEAARPRPPRRTAPPMQTTTAPPKPGFRLPEKPKIDNDPLGGLPLSKSGAF